MFGKLGGVNVNYTFYMWISEFYSDENAVRDQSGAVKLAFGFRPNSLSVSCIFSLNE